ncbi:MAG: hypothetical protein IIT63_05610, partial [Prevotella sp.]|nr:hypothetical protein [Prevotella sp.]
DLNDESVEYIIKNHLKDLGENRIQHISKSTGLTVSQVQAAADAVQIIRQHPNTLPLRIP